MTHRHHATREFSLAEHEQALREQQSQTRQKLAKNAKVTANNKSPTAATPEESEESEEEDDEEDAGIGGADGDEADDYFLQPLGGRDRRQMLKSAGVTVDKDERVECQTIRISRQTCGCSCQGQCLPDTCECARDNVKCQVDRPSFPCGCTANGCANPVGRVEFNPVRVRTHYVQTMMRLRLEQQTRFRGTAVPSPTHFRFDDDGPTYCTPPPPAIYNQSQQSLCGSLVNSELNDSANCALANGGVVVDSNGSMGYAPNNGHLTPTFPAVHTFFYPNQHMQSPAIAALGSNGYAHNTLGHHHPLAMQQHLSTQFSLNSSFSTDSGFDE
uniref:Cysteine/serine-rich nuclear protein N-terminal domain-containing protein n=1 Tax=Plectus sambesii TaxID=2011161 RepID=A0A914X1Z1_9BILA